MRDHPATLDKTRGVLDMDFKKANTNWIETLFDVSEPYLYVVVLPALVMFALGFRSQALVFSLGAAAFFAILGAA